MKKTRAQAFVLLLIYLLCIIGAHTVYSSAASEEAAYGEDCCECIALKDSNEADEQLYISAISHTATAKRAVDENEKRQVGSRFYELLFGKGSGRQAPTKTVLLCPAGEAFGIKIHGTGVRVTSAVPNGKADSEGLMENDRIIKVCGKEVHTVSDVKAQVRASEGKPIYLTVDRDGKVITVTVKPTKLGEDYRLGASLSDTTSGIGTITYIDPETRAFGGLGHGVCEGKGGKVLDMNGGEATTVVLGGAVKGERGAPGELRGILTDKVIGNLTTNSECGVFGYLSDDACDELTSELQAIEVGNRYDVKEGAATVISTVKNGKSHSFSVEISEIDRDCRGNKSFRIKVTDPALIALTGGIVRGMSGSPIIQDGKLVGAVTHVLVADPTEGYGIFIENMLETANNANNNSQKAA